MTAGDHDVPLCVDLDGTLVRTDTLHESIVLLAKTSPRSLPHMVAWLRFGKAHFKDQISKQVDLDVEQLPFDDQVVQLVNNARAQGRRTCLVTAANGRIAHKIAESTGWFDEVLCSDASINLSRHCKAEALVERFGEAAFDYVGNSGDDVPIFARARRGILICSKARLRSSAKSANSNMTYLEPQRGAIGPWVKALRIHQWLKNTLIFVPLVASGQITNFTLLSQCLLAFLAFSMLASSVYILNDLLDVEADRRHGSKRHRPFASGRLSISSGVAAAPVLALAALVVALFLPPLFAGVIVGYGVITSAYSIWLKRQVIVDVMLLASLYTLRILAGSAATGIEPSFWLLALSMFMFLSLALTKRYSELRLEVAEGRLIPGRGYMSSDLPVILSLGVGSGLVAVLILALYTQAAVVPALYPAPEWLWLVPPLILYWVCRLWMKAGRGEVDDDPVVFAARDWQSLTIVVAVGALFLLGRSGWWPL